MWGDAREQYRRARLTDITPRHIASFVGWLCEQTKPAATAEDSDRRVSLSDNTVRNALSPLKACLSTARPRGPHPPQPCERGHVATSRDG